jgi:hypothetical protein
MPSSRPTRACSPPSAGRISSCCCLRAFLREAGYERPKNQRRNR